MWGRRVNRGILDMFQALARTMGKTGSEPIFSHFAHDHLFYLWKSSSATSHSQKNHELVRNGSATHFFNKQSESSMSVQEEDQLLEMVNDGSHKTTFATITLPMFWIEVMAEYPEVATKTLDTLLPFLTSFLYEAGLSATTTAKNKATK